MAKLKMNLIGDGIELTEAIKSVIHEKFSKLERFLGSDSREIQADVIVKKEKFRASVEVII